MSRDEVLRSTQRTLEMEEVPAGKWTRMIQRTIAGLVILGLAVFAASVGWSQWIVLGLGIFAAHIWSGQVVSRSLLAFGRALGELAEPLAKIRAAWKDRNGGSP
jgi:hypothetical protein